jgi:hypothetical protein
MAAVASVLTSGTLSASIQNGSTLAPHSASTTQATSAHSQKTGGAPGDIVYVSRASALLSQVEQQLKKTPPTEVTQVLSSAATDILAQAQAENDPTQAKVLENLAARLQVAANSGSSLLPPYSLTSLLGG